MYEYHLRKNIKIKDLNYTIIKTICNAMDKGVTIDLKDLELDADKLPQNLKDLLESYQKFIQESPNSSLKLYALKNMTLNIQQLNEEIESLKVKKNYLEQQVANLEKENKAYSKKLSLIKEIANDTTI